MHEGIRPGEQAGRWIVNVNLDIQRARSSPIASAFRTIVPANVSPGKASRVNFTFSPVFTDVA